MFRLCKESSGIYFGRVQLPLVETRIYRAGPTIGSLDLATKLLSPHHFGFTIQTVEAVAYLEEAVASFYADCLLASTVMLGVAAEAKFLRVVDVASTSQIYGSKFATVSKPVFIAQKVIRFLGVLKPLIPALPRDATEDLDTNFLMVQSVLRIARNQAGHPTAGTPQREQVYVNLQLFAPFARQLMRLRDALK